MITDEERKILRNYAAALLDVPCCNLKTMEAIRIASEINENIKRIKEYVRLATLIIG